MVQLIQFKRRIPGTGAPASGTGTGQITAGEPAVAISATGVADLFIGDGTAVHTLVGADRQVERAGTQDITGDKTFTAASALRIAPGQLHISGGANGNFLTTDGSGVNSWAPIPAAGIPGFSTTATYAVGDHVVYNGHIYRASAANGPGAWDADDWDRILNESDIDGQLLSDLHVSNPITGTGLTAGAALTVTPATTAQIDAGTDNVFPITSAGLRHEVGAAPSTLTTTAKTIVPAINELEGMISAVSGALRFAGTYAVPGDVVTPVTPPVVAAGALPAASAANEGAYLILTTGGTGINNAPHVAMAVNDWIVSNGTAWIHIPLHHAAETAANIGLAAVDSQTWTNVQAGVQGLFTMLHTAGNAAVLADHTSILGDGTSTTPLTASVGELRVGTIDGGVY